MIFGNKSAILFIGLIAVSIFLAITIKPYKSNKQNDYDSRFMAKLEEIGYYKITQDGVELEIFAKNILRFKERDELNELFATRFDEQKNLENVSAKSVISKNGYLEFFENINYSRSDGLFFGTSGGRYSIKDERFVSNERFELGDKSIKAKGEKMIFDLRNRKISAENIIIKSSI